MEDVSEILGELPGDPVKSTIHKCAACKIPFRGTAELCKKCEEESFFCVNCGEEKGEFLCLFCIVSGVPHCMFCKRPPKEGGNLCAQDQADFDREKIVPALSIPAVHAADYNTQAAFDAEMELSHRRADPHGDE